jgi:hypothetical protein
MPHNVSNKEKQSDDNDNIDNGENIDSEDNIDAKAQNQKHSKTN